MTSFVGYYEPRGKHSIPAHAIDRIVALCGIVPYALVAIVLRLVVAWGIFMAGQAKVLGPTIPLSLGGWAHSVVLPANPSDGVLASFASLFPSGPLSSTLLAHCFVYGEFILPICLVLGFATRIAAALLFLALVPAELYLMPGGIPVEHVYWGAMLLVLMTCGAGTISLDRIIRALYRR